MKKIFPKNTETILIRNQGIFFSGYAKSFLFSLRSKEQKKVSGRFKEIRGSLFSSKKIIEGKLTHEMAFQKRWGDWYYQVSIIPDSDVEVSQ